MKYSIPKTQSQTLKDYLKYCQARDLVIYELYWGFKFPLPHHNPVRSQESIGKMYKMTYKNVSRILKKLEKMKAKKLEKMKEGDRT